MKSIGPGKRVAMFQSNYIPWKGFFDIIKNVDEFILFDVAQYTKKNWRNRNYIKSPSGKLRLTIPVNVKGRFNQAIDEVTVVDNHWRKKHWRSIQGNYRTANYFNEYCDAIEALYLDCSDERLSEINYRFIVAINNILGIETKLSWARDYNYSLSVESNDAIIELLKEVDAEIFINGPTSQDYMTEEMFAEHGIRLHWMDYSSYPEYHQLYPPFVHDVSILDLIFNEGPNSLRYFSE